jgi:hypothetical protein
MRLSRNYTTEDWKRLTFSQESDWQTAVRIFKDRIETRYLEHIQSLLAMQTSGFVVLALDCALIETLEQFRQGKQKTPLRAVRRYFEAFLTETAFRDHFNTTTAGLFYTEIRCGLLHQTEAGGNSRVKRSSKLPLVSTTVDGKGIVINTPLFHDLLVQVYQSYATSLLSGSDTDLRSKFRHKMNYICRVEGASHDADALPIV